MNEKTLLLSNIYCLAVPDEQEVQRGVDLLIKGNLIYRIGPHNSLEKPQGCRIIDCSRLVVIPGLVNTHHHFYQTLTRNHPHVQNAELFEWLTFLYTIWQHLDVEGIYYSSLLAIAELVKTGCTCTTDHHYIYPRHVTEDVMGAQFAASDALGIRFSPTRGSMSLGRKEGGLPPDSVVQSSDQILKDSQRVIEAFHDPSPMAMHKIILAPCSPFSVTKELMKESSELARSYGVRLHTHLAETRDENDYCLSVYNKRPLALMEECQLIGPDVFYAHGIHFTDEELTHLAQSGAQIAHCPSSNMRLGSGICRVTQMLEKGITVGLGVDGSASNDSSDMLGELRNALLLQRVEKGAGSLTVREVLDMATINGAKMLNFGNIGRIKEGWAADLALFDVFSLPYAGSLSDPLAALLFCGNNHNAAYTIVNGSVVVDQGKLVGIDEDELVRKANAISFSMIGKANCE